MDDYKKLRDIIKGIKVAMLTTVADDGALHSRPMMTQEAEFDGTVWFFTSDESPKTKELLHDRHVNVSYADADDNRYASLSGVARTSQDREKIKELWNPAYQAWFPKGLDDPHLALIKVDVESAQFWKSPSSAAVHLFGMAKAAITGKPARNAGENEKLDFHKSP